ncbi:MAG TPA: hypothetical protein VG916_02630 [Gemmatimonadaceae bacterium]|nr:hypothetical protein [Gemmatimonadaceae bacterium]
MTRQLALRTLVVTLAFIAASLLAWWALPVAAAMFGALTRDDRSGAVVAGTAGMLSWAVLLAWDAWAGPVGQVAATLGGVLQIKAVAVYVLTLAFPGLLAVCAAIVARAVARATMPARAPAAAATATPPA